MDKGRSIGGCMRYSDTLINGMGRGVEGWRWWEGGEVECGVWGFKDGK